MNVSNITARTAILGASLALAFSVAYIARAEVSIVTATLDGLDTPLTVEPGATVDVDLTVARSGSEEENDWEGTSYQIGDDSAVCLDIPNPDVVDNNDNSLGTFDITAPTATGTYEVVIGIYRDDVDSATTTDNNPCPSFLRATTSLTLIVEDPAEPVVEPFLEVISVEPNDAIRNPGDPITYGAEIEVGGDPTAAHLQCVVFDINNDDAFQEVSVDINATGTYNIEQGYDLSGFATGTYGVRAIAFDFPCDDLAEEFDPDDFDTAGLFATTTLTIGEANTLDIDITGEGSGSVQADGVLIDDITCFSDGDGEQDCSGTYASGTVIMLSVTTGGDSDFTGWSTVSGNAGTCTGESTSCEITLTGDTSLTANFDDDDDDGGGGGGGGGRRISLSDPDYNDSLNDDDDDEDEDEDEDDDDDDNSSGSGQVLGDATTIIPAGAPATGSGGTSPMNISLPLLTAILATHSKVQKLSRTTK